MKAEDRSHVGQCRCLTLPKAMRWVGVGTYLSNLSSNVRNVPSLEIPEGSLL
jgi:hypothetical protein